MSSAANILFGKRRPGRPKGSKNKTSSTQAAVLAPDEPLMTEPEVEMTTSEQTAPQLAEAPEQAQQPVKRRPGRPKGSKNKPKETAPAPAATTEPAKRRPGRPKGSKNKPKVMAETPAATTAPAATMETSSVSDAAPAKRRPGRPKGSKNKPKVTAETPTATTTTTAVETAAPAKRRPGRPKGSKNKPKVTTAPAPAATAAPAKRGPGRPKGSKNKPKVMAETPVATTAPVKRGPGRPRKNVETAPTGTNVRKVLDNPFKVGDTVQVPSGSVFTSSAPTAKGRQIVRRRHDVTVYDIIPARVQPRKSEKGSNVLVRPPRIRAKGSGGYWKDITLTEKLIRLNGKTPTYESISFNMAAPELAMAS